MKREGFTLIELLAVIVILAIIALIATPIVLNIINDAKKESNERSIEMYASAVKNAVATYQLKEGKAPTTFEDLEEYITYEGAEVVCDEEVLNNDGSIYLASCKVGNTLVEGYTYGEKETVSYKKYNNGDVVYFNVTTGESCTDYTESQSATGVKEGCMKFYAFNDSEASGTVNLLLDHNTTSSLSWGNDSEGPTTLLAQLQSDTGSWKGTETPTNYSLETSEANYTIDYTGYKARLISAEEIAQITGNTSWDVTTDSSGFSCGDNMGWLYDRTSTNCVDYGCLNNSDIVGYGYWTVSFNSNSDILYAWKVSLVGTFTVTDISSSGTGLRPVIEVLKSKLS